MPADDQVDRGGTHHAAGAVAQGDGKAGTAVGGAAAVGEFEGSGLDAGVGEHRAHTHRVGVVAQHAARRQTLEAEGQLRIGVVRIDDTDVVRRHRTVAGREYQITADLDRSAQLRAGAGPGVQRHIQHRGVVDRRDADGQGADGAGVERVGNDRNATVPVGRGCEGIAAVCGDGDGTFAGDGGGLTSAVYRQITGHLEACHRQGAVDVTVVGQHVAGGGNFLGDGVGIGDRHRRIIDRRHRRTEQGAGRVQIGGGSTGIDGLDRAVAGVSAAAAVVDSLQSQRTGRAIPIRRRQETQQGGTVEQQGAACGHRP